MGSDDGAIDGEAEVGSNDGVIDGNEVGIIEGVVDG